MKNHSNPAGRKGANFTVLILAALLALIFWRSFLSDYVAFSNDGPLGPQNANFFHLPEAINGMWDDLNDTGSSVGCFSPSISMAFKWVLGPVGYSKFAVPLALLILGLGAWSFFRSLRFAAWVSLLAAVAAMLTSTFFSDACWGLAPHPIAYGMVFFALALVNFNDGERRWLVRWTRFALAGLCVGINVIEAADIGALSSIMAAAYVAYKSLTEPGSSVATKISRGVGQVIVIALFAGLIAFQTVSSLVGTSIQGVAGTGQDTETRAQHWDWATQWSLPKKETLGIVVPGLFGYKMDTPKDIMPGLESAYQGGVYWGGVGRDPALDRWLDAGGQGTPPSGFMRFTSGVCYCGILVVLLSIWAAAQSLRRNGSVFTDGERKMIWFWLAGALISLPLAWGRFAPGSESADGFLFYALLYKLPYFSTIRNPAKFVIFFSWAVAVLFGYGLHGLCRRHLDAKANKPLDLIPQIKNWWARAGGFDRKWLIGCLIALGVAVVGYLIYASENSQLVAYLQRMGFPDEAMAQSIAAFSIKQVFWFIPLLAIAIALVTLTVAGYFNGPRAKLGIICLGGFLLFDLGRADLPYVVHWNYKQKYEVGTLNPIVDFLRQKPYEHRVAGLPFRAPEGLELFDQLYRIEWMQHHFPYYNIQCLDIIQMPRMPVDLKAYLEALTPTSNDSVPLLARRWQLTNTRYLLGAAGFVEVLNHELDPEQKRFRIVQRFDIAPKPGITRPTQLEELTAYPSANGNFALIEFTGALPRASLYGNWQVNTNDQANLKTLANLNFDPAKTVLISTPETGLPTTSTNNDTGTVDFKSYAPMHIVLEANAKAPSVLLLNDRYDPNWRVSVDGKPAELLRCDFLMRGVQVPPGQHTITFDFSLPNKPLYVTLTALAAGIILCGMLFLFTRQRNEGSAQP